MRQICRENIQGFRHELKNSPKAEYIPCAAHSLNLVGVSAVEFCLEAP